MNALIVPPHYSAGSEHELIRVFVFEYLEISSVRVRFVFVPTLGANMFVFGVFVTFGVFAKSFVFGAFGGLKFLIVVTKVIKMGEKHQFVSKKFSTCLRCLHANSVWYLECSQWKIFQVFGHVCWCVVKCLQVFV